MKLLKTIPFVFLMSVFLISPNLTFASDALKNIDVKSVTAGSATSSKAIPVAQVNIENPRIVSQNGNVFNIAFDISNRNGLQTGVKYGVELFPDKGNYVVDEKVYDDSLTLYENFKVSENITYTAPARLSGKFTLFLVSNNESGFPFSIAPLGSVTLTASKKEIDIANDSCYLEVNDGKDNKHHTLAEGVYVNKDESMNLTCEVVNHSDLPVSVNPSFETRYFSQYGKVAPQSEVKDEPISLVKGEKKTVSLALPVGLVPQFYNLKVNLAGGNISSNDVYVHYVVNGTSAMIQKLSLDKDIYKKGENGNLSLIWSASSGNLDSGSQPVALTLNATIKSDNGKDCIDPIANNLTHDNQNPITDIPFKIKKECVNPHVFVSISDTKGTILDQKDFGFKTKTNDLPKSTNINSIVIVLVIITLLTALCIYIKRKKTANSIINKSI